MMTDDEVFEEILSACRDAVRDGVRLSTGQFGVDLDGHRLVAKRDAEWPEEEGCCALGAWALQRQVADLFPWDTADPDDVDGSGEPPAVNVVLHAARTRDLLPSDNDAWAFAYGFDQSDAAYLVAAIDSERRAFALGARVREACLVEGLLVLEQ